mmetsp:Transcript_31247/g.101443  ORF Transcript_31247/g.101443 Transcript_31247/m.101443 type:complete len:669 (+) Transcript_31247:118-2124(+)
MTSILIGWVNEELQLDPPLTEATLAGELSSGFVLGALLHRHNQLPQHHKLRRRDTADSKIQNFCLLEPALCKLGVRFDANVAHGIMRATPGSAAMVLYQLKIALDKLVKFATPVSLHASRDGVQPLPNLPARPSKPQFDGARARLFEASVRLRADNPNDVLMKRHLRRFEDEAEKMENARLREKEAAVEELGRQLEASRASRIYQRQQEAAFLASWEARGLEHWAANRQRAFDRKAQRARTIARLADDGSMRRLRARKAECAAMKSEVDGFERRLATRDATAKASAPDAFDELEEVDRDDPLSQYSRSVAPTVEIGVGVGGNTATRDVVLDNRALQVECDAQNRARREATAERDAGAAEREQRRRRYITEREGAQVVEYHAHAAAHLQAQLTRRCTAERALTSRLALVSRHRARMAESRAFRAAQYNTRRDIDLEETLKRDQARLDAHVDSYALDLDVKIASASTGVDARASSKRQAAVELCADVLDRVVALSLEIADLRDVERPAPVQQGMVFHATKSLAEKEGDPVALPPWHDAKRVFATLERPIVAFGVPPADEPKPSGVSSMAWVDARTSLADHTSLRLGPVVPVVPETGPAHWPPIPADEPLPAEPEEVASHLDALDVDEYVLNAPPLRFSQKLADVETAALDDPAVCGPALCRLAAEEAAAA